MEKFSSDMFDLEIFEIKARLEELDSLVFAIFLALEHQDHELALAARHIESLASETEEKFQNFCEGIKVVFYETKN